MGIATLLLGFSVCFDFFLVVLLELWWGYERDEGNFGALIVLYDCRLGTVTKCMFLVGFRVLVISAMSSSTFLWCLSSKCFL